VDGCCPLKLGSCYFYRWSPYHAIRAARVYVLIHMAPAGRPAGGVVVAGAGACMPLPASQQLASLQEQDGRRSPPITHHSYYPRTTVLDWSAGCKQTNKQSTSARSLLFFRFPWCTFCFSPLWLYVCQKMEIDHGRTRASRERGVRPCIILAESGLRRCLQWQSKSLAQVQFHPTWQWH